jgi:hypothetical protein
MTNIKSNSSKSISSKIFNCYPENRSVGYSPKKSKRVVLNIRGVKYDVILDVLGRWPQSRLGRLKQMIESNNQSLLHTVCDDFDMKKHEFYFSRDPHVFNLILNFYSTNHLHIDNNTCVMLINQEFSYWELDDTQLSYCCESNFLDKRHDIERDMHKEKVFLDEYFYKEKFDNFYWPELREKLWLLFEKPSSSYFARVILFIYFIYFST